eukprot:Nk52_evm43s1737 gene=Nk52_evmTU43s1737
MYIRQSLLAAVLTFFCISVGVVKGKSHHLLPDIGPHADSPDKEDPWPFPIFPTDSPGSTSNSSSVSPSSSGLSTGAIVAVSMALFGIVLVLIVGLVYYAFRKKKDARDDLKSESFFSRFSGGSGETTCYEQKVSIPNDYADPEKLIALNNAQAKNQDP